MAEGAGPVAPVVKGYRIAVLAVALVAVTVMTVLVVVGEPWSFLARHRGALLAVCAGLFVAVLLLGLLWIFDFAAEAIPKGSRLFAVLLLDGAAIGIAIAAATHGAIERRAAWLGGMLGVIAVITFFGVLWSYPANVLAKGSVRSALAATVTLVYLTVAGMLVFDLGLLDQTPMAQAVVVVEGTQAAAFTDADDIFETMTWAFMVVIGFYFTATTVEAVSRDRTTSAAVKSATDDTLAGLRQQEQDAIDAAAQ